MPLRWGQQKTQSFESIEMIVTTLQKYTFEDYQTNLENREIKCELVNGELVEIPPASGLHADILDFLQDLLKQEIKKTIAIGSFALEPLV